MQTEAVVRLLEAYHGQPERVCSGTIFLNGGLSHDFTGIHRVHMEEDVPSYFIIEALDSLVMVGAEEIEEVWLGHDQHGNEC